MATGMESSLRQKKPFLPEENLSSNMGCGVGGNHSLQKAGHSCPWAQGEGTQGRGVPIKEREGGHEENWI